MSEDSGDGGYTGNADGAPYSGSDAGPDSSDAGVQSPAPAPHEIYDPPIEHDPIGQALVGLPFAVVTGVGSAISEGASVVAGVGEEVIAWGAAELGLAGVDAATEGGSEASGSGGGDGAGDSSSDSSGGVGGADGGVGAYDSEQ
jgi:hypothetical protein